MAWLLTMQMQMEQSHQSFHRSNKSSNLQDNDSIRSEFGSHPVQKCSIFP